MDIKITYTSLKKFLETDTDAEEIAAKVSLCGPTFDRITKVNDDYLYEIEAITNRVDTASVQGIARESAAILTQFDIPAKMINDPYKDIIDLHESLPSNFSIQIEDEKLTPRFCAISLQNITIGESPKETINFLDLCGLRPINNAVDITNELTVMYGMPCHIFDLDKIKNKYLLIRESKPGETVTTLDETTCKLQGKDIVIEDGDKKIIDLCGVMGGQLAVVDSNTKNILLIVPTYLPSKIRKTSLYLQKRTLASQIYEKQPDPELCLPVLMAATRLFEERVGATVSSKVFDYYPNPKIAKEVSMEFSWLNNFVGITFDQDQIVTILNNLGFKATIKDQLLICQVPSSRYFDINIREDIAEEITRVYGYFRLPSVIPYVNLESMSQNPIFNSELKAKKYLSNIGFSEIYNNSLVSSELLKKTNFNSEENLKLTNALSSDYEYLRTSLIPSLLINIKNNQGKNFDELNLYELSNIYLKRTRGKIPDEISTLALISNKNFRETKGILESLLKHINTSEPVFKSSTNCSMVFLKNKTADIYIDNTLVGQIGYLDPSVLRALEITSNPVAFEINYSKTTNSIKSGYTYEPISSFPEMIEDMTIKSSLPIGEIISKIKLENKLVKTVTYLTTFENNHSFKITFSSPENNLDQNTVNSIKEKIATLFN